MYQLPTVGDEQLKTPNYHRVLSLCLPPGLPHVTTTNVLVPQSCRVTQQHI